MSRDVQIRPGSAVPTPRQLPPVYRWRPERDAELRNRKRLGQLVVVRRGVYADAIDPATSRWDRAEHEHLLMVAAAMATLRTPSWVSHQSAALLHGCWLYRPGRSAEVTQLAPPDVRDRGGTLKRHWTELPARDRTELAGVPVTTLERTIVDCARALPGESAIGVVESGLRMGADRGLVERILAESTGKRGVRSARQVVALADGRVEGLGEARLRWQLAAEGLPPPDAAIAVETHLGTRWIDVGWPDVRVGFEFDGRVKYSGAYGDPDEVLWEEKLRHDALVEAGWLILRITWDDLRDPQRLASRARQARSQARARALTHP